MFLNLFPTVYYQIVNLDLTANINSALNTNFRLPIIPLENLKFKKENGNIGGTLIRVVQLTQFALIFKLHSKIYLSDQIVAMQEKKCQKCLLLALEGKLGIDWK